MTARRPTWETQTWLQDGLTVTTEGSHQNILQSVLVAHDFRQQILAAEKEACCKAHLKQPQTQSSL